MIFREVYNIYVPKIVIMNEVLTKLSQKIKRPVFLPHMVDFIILRFEYPIFKVTSTTIGQQFAVSNRSN